MPLMVKGGKLLVVGGLLATSESCCCRNFESCAECLAALQGLRLNISGYPDAIDSLGGTCSWSAINGSYALTVPDGTNKFKIVLGQNVDCNLGGRGIQYYQRVNGSTTRTAYMYELAASVSCSGANVALVSVEFRGWATIETGASCSAGTIAPPPVPSAGACLTTNYAAWEAWCAGGQSCWNMDGNDSPFFCNFTSCENTPTPMVVDICARPIF